MSAAYPKRSAQHLAAREAFFEFHIVAGKHILRKWLQDPRLIHSVSWTKPNGCCDLRLTTMCSWNHVLFTALATVCLQTAIIHATMSVHRVVLCFSRLRCQGVWKLALHVLADVSVERETNWLLTRAVAVAAQTNSKLATVQHLHDITMQVSLPIYPSHPSYRGAVDLRSIIYMPATCQLNPT